jgi:RNA-directed DNA polymerase
MGTQWNPSKGCAPINIVPSIFHSWDGIPWKKFKEDVRKLQIRIAKAHREGKPGRVKALQRTLTRSLAAKCLAVKRVSENKGKYTPGVDGIVWNTPEEKLGTALSLKRRGYTALPLRRLLIPKKNGKQRPLGIPTMNDRAFQALHQMALIPISEETADPNSYGFRPYRSTADAMEQCFIALARQSSPQWIMEGDIVGCFDNIDHNWLMTHIPMDKEILRKWLKAGYIYDRTLFPTRAGTPQGSIVSPSLANMVLDGLEGVLKERFSRRDMINFVRYADDFVITGRSKELLEQEVRPVVEQFLRERGLELSQEKTCIVHIEEGFDFLGQNVRKYGTQLLTTPSRKNIASFLDKVRTVIKDAKATAQRDLIETLNPIIRGWANFHRHIVAKDTFSRVDYQIWEGLWNWATRRHPDKGAHWIKKRYFQQRGSRQWVFTSPKGKGPELKLASDTPIRRHVKIRKDANPFDPAWADYFLERTSRKESQLDSWRTTGLSVESTQVLLL